jgi:hypothetical protein
VSDLSASRPQVTLSVAELNGLEVASHDLPPSDGSMTDVQHRGPPKAIRFVLPVWGPRFVRQFLKFGLRTLLAPGNIPAVAETLPCEFVIMTRAEDEPLFHRHLTFRALMDACPVTIRHIDHLVTGQNHTTTLTLSYLEEMRVAGPGMVDIGFIFLVSDYIFADGALGYVAKRIMKGVSGVQAGNFQVTRETAFPWLEEQLGRATPALALSPRELVCWGLAHLHPVTVANTVNFSFNHNWQPNRLFWRVNGQTMLGRFYLMHMIAVRPERADFTIGASCDYAFIPEMCPSGNIETITDSDDYLVVEMQPRDHEAQYVKPGPFRPRQLAHSLSQWTTRSHRENARFSVVYHCGNRPTELGAAFAAADRFMADVDRGLLQPPKPHRNHPFWRGAIAAQHEATGMQLGLREQWLSLGLPVRILEVFEARLGAQAVEWAGTLILGRLPAVRPWHPRAPDFAPVLEKLRDFTGDRSRRLLVLSDDPSVFTVSLIDGSERVVRLRTSLFLSRPENYASLRDSFDLCLLELSDAELGRGGDLVDQISLLMKPGGQILLVIYNTRRDRDFVRSLGFHGRVLLRPSTTIEDTQIVSANRLRWWTTRFMGHLVAGARNRPWVGLPALAAAGGLVAVALAALNTLANLRRLRGGKVLLLATSAHIALRADASGRNAWRYSARAVLRRRHHGRLGQHVGFAVSGRPADTAAILSPGAQASHIKMPAAAPMPRAAAHASRHLDRSHHARGAATREFNGLATGTPATEPTDVHARRDHLNVSGGLHGLIIQVFNGRLNVAQVGCGNPRESDTVLKGFDKLTVYDVDANVIEEVHQRLDGQLGQSARQHDLLKGPLPEKHDAIFSLSAIKYLREQDGLAYISNLSRSLTDDGVLIMGCPSPLDGQSAAADRIGVAETKTGLERYFSNVVFFSIDNEAIYPGLRSAARRLIGVCSGRLNR